MDLRPATASHSWIRIGVLAGMCIGIGIAVGRLLPGPQVYRDGRPLASPPPSFAEVVAGVGDGVVAVRAHLDSTKGPAVPVAAADPSAAASGRRAVFEPTPGWRNGSGFVVHEKGLVVTSRHVVVGASEITVAFASDAACRADLVGEDEATDLALLRLVDPPASLHALALGPSESLRAGDWIVAVGNPYGFAQTVTAGVVSFIGRHLPHADFRVTSELVQFSAPVNPGSSGCPLFDVAGNVVGVTTQAATDAQGISFAVPSRTLKWALDAMEHSQDGHVRRGYLGVEFLSCAETDARGSPVRGARIVGVVDGAPAARAGIRTGDVVVAVDGVRIQDARALHERIVQGEPGGRIAFSVLRAGHVSPIDAVLSEMGGGRMASPWN